jgi:hypothetical protein
MKAVNVNTAKTFSLKTSAKECDKFLEAKEEMT